METKLCSWPSDNVCEIEALNMRVSPCFITASFQIPKDLFSSYISAVKSKPLDQANHIIHKLSEPHIQNMATSNLPTTLCTLLKPGPPSKRIILSTSPLSIPVLIKTEHLLRVHAVAITNN